VADIRYLQDFGNSTLKKWLNATDLGYMNRRGIAITIGVEYGL